MKRIFSVVAFILLIGASISNVSAEDYIIGFVSTQRLLSESPQAENLRAQIEKEFAPRDRQLQADQKKLEDMQERLTKDAAIMSESERAKLERDILTSRRDNKRNLDELREDVTLRQNEEYGKLSKVIGNAINVVAKEHKLDLVLRDSAVVFVTPKIDITNLVIDYLKNSSQKPVASQSKK